MKQNALTLILICLGICSFAQEKYKTDLDLGGGFVLTTFLDLSKKQDQYTLTSPKKADKRAFGGFKAIMGRNVGKLPRNGNFITINATQKDDSLIGMARTTVLGSLKFHGILQGNRLSGSLLRNNNSIVATINGVQTNETRINHEHLYLKIVEITEDNIYSKNILQTKEWNRFRVKLKKLCENAQDDVELYLGFNMLIPKLTFSHYNLVIQENQKKVEVGEKEATVVFGEIPPEIAYLKIVNFSSSQKEISETFPKIIENSDYESLIIDLRGNSGGGIGAAFELGKYILNQEVVVGYFVTNKFDSKDFSELPANQAKTTSDFSEELKKGKGAKLVMPQPNNPIFLGKIYVLTDSRTASTCEPIVYILKNTHRATIIGSKTAGAMLSAAYFDISGKYKLMLPLADFYTYDGIRLDQVGVTPDIETDSKNAFTEAIKLIKNKAD